ncbi:MAG: ribonuclease P protein component, partial [Acidimicrobiia bacterium]
RTRMRGVTVIESRGCHQTPEVGVVAGKHVGNAVRRNRAKRRLRAAAQLTPWRPERAYVLVASKETPDVAFGDLVEWLRQASATTAKGPEG